MLTEERTQATGLRRSREQILDDHGQVQKEMDGDSGREAKWAVVGRTVDEEEEGIQTRDIGRTRICSPCPRANLASIQKSRYGKVAAVRAPESRGAAAKRSPGGQGLGIWDMPGWDEHARARKADRALIAPISKVLEKQRDQRPSGLEKAKSRDLLQRAVLAYMRTDLCHAPTPRH